jgi:hypothetical protein
MVDFGYLKGDSFAVSFFDPRMGNTIKTTTIKDRKVQRIPSPPAEDLVLMIEAQ